MLVLSTRWFGEKNKMKKNIILLFLPFVLSLTSCGRSYTPNQLDPNVKYDNVYLIMGQSNASGVSEYSYLAQSHPEIYQTYSAGNEKVLMSFDVVNKKEEKFVPTKFGFGHDTQYFGPEIGIADTLSKYEDSCYMVKASLGGSYLMTQYVTEKGYKKELYYKFVSFIQKQVKKLENSGKNPRIRGVFWMQGESDSFLEYKEKYRDAEQYLFEYLRHDLNKWIYDHFNFVDAYIFTRGICWVEPEKINKAKQEFCDSNEHCYCIKTNGEDENAIMTYIKVESNEEEDLAHYDSKSMLLLGQTAGEYLVK